MRCRRPVVSVRSVASTAKPQHRDKRAVRAFDVATLTFVALFAARYLVHDWL